MVDDKKAKKKNKNKLN